MNARMNAKTRKKQELRSHDPVVLRQRRRSRLRAARIRRGGVAESRKNGSSPIRGENRMNGAKRGYYSRVFILYVFFDKKQKIKI